MLSFLVSTFGEVAITALLKAFTGWLFSIENMWTNQQLGASKQREEDLRNELERITKAVDAGNAPDVLSPDGMRSDPSNRDNQPS